MGDFLSNIDILSSLQKHEFAKIVEAMRSKVFSAGADVIVQGHTGTDFFIVEEGSATAFKDGCRVKTYGPKDYFGELALLHDAPRAATVRAETELRVVTLDRLSFKRLLGPLDAILKDRARDTYNRLSVTVQ